MLFKSCGQRKAGSVYIVEMIVVKAVGDNGMKESQGFLSLKLLCAAVSILAREDKTGGSRSWLPLLFTHPNGLLG